MDLQASVAKYRRTVYRVAIGYVKNSHDADDVTQNVFLKLYQRGGTFESDEAEKAWLIRVAINESKNLLKSAWRNNTCELDESIVAQENDDLGLYDYLKRLKPKYRTVILLYYYEGYSVKEVAELLKIPQRTILTQMKRAREQLKIMILEEESELEGYCYGKA
jgi:RNA polymerase sigma-70 factor (ECF subfamily)